MITENRLRDVRMGKGISIAELAVRAECSPTSIVAIERHGHRPGYNLRIRLADALRTSPADIWPGIADYSERRLVAIIDDLLTALNKAGEDLLAWENYTDPRPHRGCLPDRTPEHQPSYAALSAVIRARKALNAS